MSATVNRCICLCTAMGATSGPFCFNINKDDVSRWQNDYNIVFQSKADNPRCVFSHVRMTRFLLLWPWPWPDDLNNTCVQKMKFLGQGFQTGQTGTQADMTERIITPHSRVAQTS